jgi:sporulation protein YlmC with PRC-barrel domain
MLRRFTRLQGSRIVALDGEIGKVCDFYFDDIEWVVRYLIVDTGVWLPGRKVLIPSQAVDSIDHVLHAVLVSLTRERIDGSPNVDMDRPVSRGHESEFNRYYGDPAYWGQSGNWGRGPLPPAAPSASDLLDLDLQERRMSDVPHSESHLRSAQEVVAGYSVRAVDDSAGRVRDLLFDDETWALRYLVVETRRWFFGRRVLLRQGSVERVDWAGRCVDVSRMREQIEHGCEFDPNNPPLGDLASALKRAANCNQIEH